MVYWCMCTDDRPPHRVPVEEELIEPRPDNYKTMLPGECNSDSYINQEYSSQHVLTALSESRRRHIGDRISKDATQRVVTVARRQTRRVENPRPMAEDDPDRKSVV